MDAPSDRPIDLAMRDALRRILANRAGRVAGRDLLDLDEPLGLGKNSGAAALPEPNLRVCRRERDGVTLVFRRSGTASFSGGPHQGVWVDMDRSWNVLSVDIRGRSKSEAVRLLRAYAVWLQCPDLSLAADWVEDDRAVLLRPSVPKALLQLPAPRKRDNAI